MISGFCGEFTFLSNFHPCEVELDGVVYPFVEHAFQSAKTDDPEIRALIQAAPNPRKAQNARSSS
jgi:predicted NAD-dependent protein-ADP-ribosyltransferase YbiA (DUF1768 family)